MHYRLHWIFVAFSHFLSRSVDSLSFVKMSYSGVQNIENYKKLTSSKTPFSNDEIQNVLKSLKNVTPSPSRAGSFNEEEMRNFLEERAHLNHKEWEITDESAQKLRSALLPKGSIETNDAFKTAFRRVLEEGNWFGAASFASVQSSKNDYKPWIVLVTGVNGIRKTTTIYQPWFENVLREALEFSADSGSPAVDPSDILPIGKNSFFRQLDHMIAVLANEDFSRLYGLDDLKQYAELKDGVFVRYRKTAESLGVLLLKEAQARKMNAMVETSGRDIAMFRYVDYFFNDKDYNKLVIHFKVNDISFAEQSVDSRMEKEILDGKGAVSSADFQKIIDANAGGPYGSEVLKGVQADSAKVWESVLSGEDAGKSWYKASICIDGNADCPWTAAAIASDGTRGKRFEFTPRK